MHESNIVRKIFIGLMIFGLLTVIPHVGVVASSPDGPCDTPTMISRPAMQDTGIVSAAQIQYDLCRAAYLLYKSGNLQGSDSPEQLLHRFRSIAQEGHLYEKCGARALATTDPQYSTDQDPVIYHEFGCGPFSVHDIIDEDVTPDSDVRYACSLTTGAFAKTIDPLVFSSHGPITKSVMRTSICFAAAQVLNVNAITGSIPLPSNPKYPLAATSIQISRLLENLSFEVSHYLFCRRESVIGSHRASKTASDYAVLEDLGCGSNGQQFPN